MMFSHLWPNICAHIAQSKAASVSEILHFIGCEKPCALHLKSKYDTQNQILLHWSLVKGWQFWTDTECYILRLWTGGENIA